MNSLLIIFFNNNIMLKIPFIIYFRLTLDISLFMEKRIPNDFFFRKYFVLYCDKRVDSLNWKTKCLRVHNRYIWE